MLVATKSLALCSVEVALVFELLLCDVLDAGLVVVADLRPNVTNLHTWYWLVRLHVSDLHLGSMDLWLRTWLILHILQRLVRSVSSAC